MDSKQEGQEDQGTSTQLGETTLILFLPFHGPPGCPSGYSLNSLSTYRTATHVLGMVFSFIISFITKTMSSGC